MQLGGRLLAAAADVGAALADHQALDGVATARAGLSGAAENFEKGSIADLLTKVSGVVGGNGFFPKDPGTSDHGPRHTGCDQVVDHGLDFRKFRHIFVFGAVLSAGPIFLWILSDKHIRLSAAAADYPDVAGIGSGGLFFLLRLFGLGHQLAQLFFKFLSLFSFHSVCVSFLFKFVSFVWGYFRTK